MNITGKGTRGNLLNVQFLELLLKTRINLQQYKAEQCPLAKYNNSVEISIQKLPQSAELDRDTVLLPVSDSALTSSQVCMTEPIKLLTQLLTQQGFLQEPLKEKLSTSKLDAQLFPLKRLS